MAVDGWRNRIVRTDLIDPREVEPHVHNWRQHPIEQRRALEAALREIGWVQGVVVNERTGRLIDGHLRVVAALESDEQLIPVTYVDLNEDEELKALASLDAISGMAITDDVALKSLLNLIEASDEDLGDFFDSLSNEVEPLDFDDDDGFDDEPIIGTSEPEVSPDSLIRQLTFNVTLDERDIIVSAIDSCRADTMFTPAEALTIICREYLDER